MVWTELGEGRNEQCDRLQEHHTAGRRRRRRSLVAGLSDTVPGDGYRDGRPPMYHRYTTALAMMISNSVAVLAGVRSALEPVSESNVSQASKLTRLVKITEAADPSQAVLSRRRDYNYIFYIFKF